MADCKSHIKFSSGEQEEQLSPKLSFESLDIPFCLDSKRKNVTTKTRSCNMKMSHSVTDQARKSNLKLIPWAPHPLKEDLEQKFSSVFKLATENIGEKLYKNVPTYSKESVTEDSKRSNAQSEDARALFFPSPLPKDIFSEKESSSEDTTVNKKDKTQRPPSRCSVCSPKEIDLKKCVVKVKMGGPPIKQRLFKNLMAQFTEPENACLRIPLKKKTPQHLRTAAEAPLSMRLTAIAQYHLNNIVNNNPVFDWSVERVSKWISDDLKMPQYRRNFLENSIAGRHLVLMNAETLEQMGIRNFDDVIKISENVRNIFKLQKEINVNLFLTKARFDPPTLFSMYSYKSGYDKSVGAFFKKHHLVLKKKPFCSLFEIKRTQWDLFPKTIKTVNNRRFILKSFDSYPEHRKIRPPPRRLW
ncbi:uncharacterized protein LOC106674011 isoform X2 [Cimex lectularius]|uniref:SAM domain-containing protein n=1 Tax=Cimex lectularius TaxID=79782 RepID=A0A8I6THW1_CIMLE|nr:uncharacterized protein LOC106674011 isoform X2 [Cimex lectularius]